MKALRDSRVLHIGFQSLELTTACETSLSLCWTIFSIFETGECRRRRRDANARIHVHRMRSKRKLTALSHIQPVECNSTRFNLLCDELCRNYGVILRVAKSKIVSPVSVDKCSYRHFNMFLVI